MTNFQIGSYSITSQKAYDALKQSGATSDAALKRLDKNSDAKITEDELVEFLEETNTDENSKETSAVSSGSENEDPAVVQLRMYDDIINKLEKQLETLNGKMAGTKDTEELNSILDNIENIQGQIEQNRQAIYNILVQSENKAKAAQSASGTYSATSVQSSNGYPGLTTGEGINGGSEFGNAVVNVGLSYVGKLKESDGSYLQVTGGRHEAWCADFVTYVVKQTCAQTGKSLNGFGSASVSGIMAWGQANGCYVDVAGSGNRAQTIVNSIAPGDVMINKNNGSSHTGIVTKVYPDGSFDTVEGNTSDQCLQRHYTADSAKLSGFVKIT